MKLQRLDLLEKLFGTVNVPNAVFEELISNSKYLTEAQMVVECPFLKRLETYRIKCLLNVKVSDETEAFIFLPRRVRTWRRQVERDIPVTQINHLYNASSRNAVTDKFSRRFFAS